MKRFLFLAASLITTFLSLNTFAQPCAGRILDPEITTFLKVIGYEDATLEQLRSLPIEQLKYPQLPLISYPKEDVQRIRITSDSIPVLVFNPLHKKKSSCNHSLSRRRLHLTIGCRVGAIAVARCQNVWSYCFCCRLQSSS